MYMYIMIDLDDDQFSYCLEIRIHFAMEPYRSISVKNQSAAGSSSNNWRCCCCKFVILSAPLGS